MSELEALLARVPGFYGSGHGEKILLFGWYLQVIELNARFSGSDILQCYDAAHVKRPANITKILIDLCAKTPPDLLRDAKGYHLERRVKSNLDTLYADREITVQTNRLLESLPGKVPDLKEKAFLGESLICYRHGAFRAAIVMAWNLTYSHFCEWILAKHLAAFNSQWPIRFPELHKKSKVKSILKYEHFSELKESDVIDITRSAGLIDQGIYKTLIEKLNKRNNAAHPSSNSVTQIQTEEVIHDLVENVIAKLP